MSRVSQDAANEVRCYSDSQAAFFLSCSRRHIVNLRARGAIPFAKVGNRVVIRHRDLVAFLDRNTTGGWSADAA